MSRCGSSSIQVRSCVVPRRWVLVVDLQMCCRLHDPAGDGNPQRVDKNASAQAARVFKAEHGFAETNQDFFMMVSTSGRHPAVVPAMDHASIVIGRHCAVGADQLAFKAPAFIDVVHRDLDLRKPLAQRHDHGNGWRPGRIEDQPDGRAGDVHIKAIPRVHLVPQFAMHHSYHVLAP